VHTVYGLHIFNIVRVVYQTHFMVFIIIFQPNIIIVLTAVSAL